MIAPFLIAKANDLNGTWEWKGEGFAITLVLNPDGSGKLDEADISYSVQGDHLIVNDHGDEINYRFTLAGDKLTLTGGDLDGPTTFMRKGAGASSAKGIGARKEGRVAAESQQKSVGAIAGYWTIQTPNGTIALDLKTDGSGTFAGANFTWN